MTAKELERIVLSEVPMLKETGQANIVFGEYISQQFDVYFPEENMVEVEYNGDTRRVSCDLNSSDRMMAKCIMKAFAQLYLNKNENKKYKNMKHKTRLTESALNRIIRKTVKRVLNENTTTDLENSLQNLMGNMDNLIQETDKVFVQLKDVAKEERKNSNSEYYQTLQTIALGLKEIKTTLNNVKNTKLNNIFRGSKWINTDKSLNPYQ